MPHISLVTLGVADVERASRYYEALGWRRSAASVDGTVAFLEGGTVALGLYGRRALAGEAGVDPPSRSTGAVALAMNVAGPAEVDEAMARAAAAGGTVTAPPVATDWGGYSGYVTDPDGHLWEVAHNPGFPLTDDGRVELP
jgi:uncharacterized protein